MNSEELSLFGATETGEFPLAEVLDAYHKCLRGKGGTHEAMEFRMGYMSRCVELTRQLNALTYELSRFIAFVSFYPVLREIYGSAFVDRVVDTLMAEKLTPLLEEQFVDDNYSTRKKKGALYGVMRVAEMIRQCSNGYTEDCYILKDDIKSFFMSMRKDVAVGLWESFIRENYTGADAERVVAILRAIIRFRPEKNCVRKGNPRNWLLIPPDKILGEKGPLRGFPIGKVISQLTALIYLDFIDQIVTFVWHIRNGHYMDDRVMVDRSRQKLLDAKRQIDAMHREVGLQTHPRKTYLQHYSRGVLFAGAMILPGRIYLSKRTVGNCFRRLDRFNCHARTEPGYVERHAEEFAATMNSYFGLLGHFAEWNTTHRIISEIGPEWYRVMTVVSRSGKVKISVKRRFTARYAVVSRQRRRMKRLLERE